MRPKRKSGGQAKKQNISEPEIKQEQDGGLPNTSSQTISTPSLDFSLQQLASQALSQSSSQDTGRQLSKTLSQPTAIEPSPSSEHQPLGVAVVPPRFGWTRPAVVRPSILSRTKPIRNSADIEENEEEESMEVSEDPPAPPPVRMSLCNRPARPYRPRVVMIDKNGGVFGNNVEQPEPTVPFCNNCAFEFPNLKKSLARLNQGVDEMISYVADAMKKDEQRKREENLKSEYFSNHFRQPVCELEPFKCRKKYTRTKPALKRGKYKPRIKIVRPERKDLDFNQEDENEEEDEEEGENSSSYFEEEPILQLVPAPAYNPYPRSVPSMPVVTNVAVPSKLRPRYAYNLYGIMPFGFKPQKIEEYNYMNVEKFRELSSDYALKALTNDRNDWGHVCRKQLLMEWGWWESPYSETSIFVPTGELLDFRKRFIAFWQATSKPKKNALKSMYVRLGQHKDFFQFSEVGS